MVQYKKIIFGSLVAFAFLAIGTCGYALIEDFTILDAFYMTVITISTVGYGEVHTLSEAGRMFTIFLILFGFGSIGFLAHAFTEAIVERAASRNLGKRTMQKKIDDLEKHVIICGFGRVGEAAAEHFASADSQFVLIESSEEQIKIIEEHNYLYLEADATREETLLAAGIKRAVALVALLNSDPENLFTVLTARDLNPTLHIIARTETATSESRLLRAGADSIVSPYAYAGRKVAETILESREPVDDTTEQTEAEPFWMEVTEQSDLAGHVVVTAESFLGGRIMGIRRDDTDQLCPHQDEQIVIGDQLLVIETPTQLYKSRPYTPPAKNKIVFIDDNPVIRRLYTRLFQKEGFHLLSASRGEEGYKLIQTELPDAAVVDVGLPDVSGLELCERIRNDEKLQHIKLFLFTSHDNDITRETARKAGVDTVVIKSPDAGEIVKKVKACLRKNSIGE